MVYVLLGFTGERTPAYRWLCSVVWFNPWFVMYSTDEAVDGPCTRRPRGRLWLCHSGRCLLTSLPIRLGMTAWAPTWWSLTPPRTFYIRWISKTQIDKRTVSSPLLTTQTAEYDADSEADTSHTVTPRPTLHRRRSTFKKEKFHVR